MKKLITFLMMIFLISFSIRAQESAFTVDALSDLSKIDLSDASQVSVGTISPTFGGMDFGLNDVLYGLDYNTNQLFEVDTTDASTTLIGSSVPPSTHIWTGMAYDAATGIMYAVASHGIASGSSNLYTIDVSDGSITLVGSQSTATSIACIAIDDNGQMYGLQLSASAKIYLIDKTDGSVTVLGNVNAFGGAGMGYGMDYSSDNQTMYLTAYDSFTFNNNLYTIDLTNGNATSVGFLSMWTFALAITSPFSCDFSADATTVCTGTTVNFTDASSGASSWSWTFEGGTPSTSTDQDPSVVYSTPGVYDVELEVTNGAGSTETEYKVDYITVLETPAQADTPDGESVVCTGQSYNYSITEVPYAQDYEWELSPADAGTLTPNDTYANLQVADDWTGDFTIKARATNMCGDGDWSDNLEGTVYQSPSVFNLEGGGGYCLNGDGVEITLDGSESGIDYELYLDDVPTGNIVAGTGSEISFGMITDEGYFTANASNDNCDIIMSNQLQVEILFPPLEPDAPTGPAVVCNDETSDYESDGTSDADSYVWVLDPVDAGELSSDGLTATVIWDAGFSGIAEISLYGINDCGDGNPSNVLEIDVDAIPSPEVSGQAEVCDNTSEDYSTDEIESAVYTWEATGGTISDGQGTNSITVDWGEAGDGTINVSVVTASGCAGDSEAFEVFIDDCTGIEENNLENSVSVNPNPASDFVVIHAETEIERISVLNLTGDELITEVAHGKSGKLNTSVLSPGVYLVKIYTRDRIISKKLFIR